ncbi:MAG: hypothetical protein GY807_11165 [Gammaproteobacteria bacterium]|nr:hypothetical protein [Gammaproteobacteria bacterium]
MTIEEGDDQAESLLIIKELLEGLQQSAEEIAPRFFANMPASYFHDTDQDMRLSHIKAIIAAEASGLSQTIILRNKEGTHYTSISDRSYPGQLSEFVRRLPRAKPLHSAQVYTATDGSRVLDVFDLGERALFDAGDGQQKAKFEQVLDYIRTEQITLTQTQLSRHLRACSANYLLVTPAPQICRQLHLVEQIWNTGSSLVRLESRPEYDMSSITVAARGIGRRLLFERITRYLGWQGVDIQRAYLDSFEQQGREVISLLSFLVDRSGEALDPATALWQQLELDLRQLVYLDEGAMDLAHQLPGTGLLHAEVLLALGHLVHQRLLKRDALAFSRERIVRALLRHKEHAQAIAALFVERFTVSEDSNGEAKSARLAQRLDDEIANQDECEILQSLREAVGATLRCNINLPDRYALALRIAPAFLQAPGREETPYGVYFIVGFGFDGFHVRFRDIARGGVRIVRPSGQEQYALESERLYDEVYGLAHAQQLKNKDIPEGGSKGVILAQPGTDFERVGRAYADALLDLIIPDPGLKRLKVDYLEHNEQIYLGPDENISNDLITWIVERARHRGHPMPDAFMSSKPGAGINHKLYGVTSEGVTVFLEAALRACDIDPRVEAFTVKMTGGPDGDVAGNEIRILRREYGDHARILGIADGSGCLEDPDGLDQEELLRLADEDLPVIRFNTHCLGPKGRLLTIDQPGGIQARNSMHNRLITDAFIPAGGRPRTINEHNWREFLTPAGTPSSRVIVEGANLFISPQARQQLSQQGVIIIKDSSANKCGVICSSYEIIASMLLTEREFLKMKDRFINEVLVKLRELAALEARILFHEHKHKPGMSLPELSIRLSRVIDRATDAITQVIATLEVSDSELMHRLVEEYLPRVLTELVGDDLFERIPSAYLTRVIASVLASRIVYREGLDWFEHMSDQAIADLAIRYLQEEVIIRQMIDHVMHADLPGRERIVQLLSEGGVAASLKNPEISDKAKKFLYKGGGE